MGGTSTSSTTNCYFATQNAYNEVAKLATLSRKNEYDLYSQNMPELDEDFPIICAEVALYTGLTTSKIENIFCSLYRLNELPLTKAIQEDLYLLSFDHLIAIDQTLNKLGHVEADFLSTIDEALSGYLTPKHANQQLPTPAQLRRKLRDLCKLLDDSIAFREESAKHKEHHLGIHTNSKEAIVELFTTPLNGIAIDAHIRATADEHNISQEEACIQLLTGKVTPTPKVVLHVYQANDVPDAPVYIEDHGWFKLDLTADATRDLTKECEPTESYTPPPIMRMRVQGRDGTCRFPGCNVPASKTQLDHRINHADGGPTHPDNLACLCQYHHNIKTDRRVSYVLDPHTGRAWWFFEDGTWTTSEASGPLSPSGKRWVQTSAQFLAKRRERAHEEAQLLLKQKLGEQALPAENTESEGTWNDDDDPPPF